MPSAKRRSVDLSQNFLRDPRLVDRLLDRSSLAAEDLVVEIGPGRGIITERLARRCRQVLAVEKDRRLGERLRQRFAATPNVAVFAADFADFPLPVTTYKVFANIPFNITTAILARLTEGAAPPVDAYLVVQREAAARVLGDPAETLVAVLLKPEFAPEVAHHLRPADFAPAPGVDVVLLRLRRRDRPLVAPADLPLFRGFVIHGFTAWRPTLRDALADVLTPAALRRMATTSGVDLDRPPSRVPFPDWLALFASFRLVASAPARARFADAEARLLWQQAGLQKRTRTSTPRRDHRRREPADRPSFGQ